MTNYNFGWIGKGLGVFLSIMLVALPALAQSTTEQEQSPKVQSDTIQGQPTKTLSDAERGKIDGERAGKKSVKHLLWIASGLSAGIGFPFIGGLVTNDCITGCIFGFFAGALLGFVSLMETSKPSPSVFVGKSPEYITAYEKEFRNAQKFEQMGWYHLSYGVGSGLLLAFCAYLFSRE